MPIDISTESDNGKKLTEEQEKMWKKLSEPITVNDQEYPYGNYASASKAVAYAYRASYHQEMKGVVIE